MTPATKAKEDDGLSPIARLIQGLLTSVAGARREGMDLSDVHKTVQDLADDLADNMPQPDIPVADPVRVTVKPLEWEDHPDASYAQATGVQWTINAGTYWNLYSRPLGAPKSTSFGPQGDGSLKAAKAAAQADYERRVLSCLTVADDPRVAGLVEALEVSRKALAKTNQRLAAHGYEENSATRKPVWLALKKVRTALAAFAPADEKETTQ